jgi:hypothetical protein
MSRACHYDPMPSIRRITTPGAAAAGARRFTLIAGILMAVGVFAAASGGAPAQARSRLAHPIRLAQEEAPDEKPVSADQINKYVAVYSEMQRNHSITVSQAASKQGLTVDQFRDIENRIERNPVAHERVIDALKKANKKTQPSP